MSRHVHLIDDDAEVREALALLLRTLGYTVTAHAEAQGFLAAVNVLEPGCIVTDIRMPMLSGLKLQERLREAGCAFPVVVITGHGDVEACRRAFQHGAVDFLTKPVDEQALIDAVNLALERLAEARPTTRGPGARHPLIERLSQREREILDAIAGGMTSKEIARHFGISPRTVDTHRANLAEKLGTSSVAEMVRIALEGGGR
ncbi:MAG: response regulator [Proteobacteria bacterium]|nr:response regulator [Pseudomonadota bacterium]